MNDIYCINCHQPYPDQGVPFRCQLCGGIYDFTSPSSYDPDKVHPEFPGIWPYRHSFGLPDEAPIVTLGEGQTPLVWQEYFDREVAFKLEFLNPTGSFKDRGSAVLLSFLVSRGIQSAVEDSSGNAGASFAAYATRAGIDASVYIPDYASGPKRVQIEAYGATVIQIEGLRSETSQAVLQAADEGDVYASHVYLPFGLPGYATIAFELYEQIGYAPGAVIAPVGQGNLLLAIGRGFETLRSAGLIDQLPKLVGVQALACAPIWAVYKYGATGLNFVIEGETLAEGVRVKHPLRGDTLLRDVEDSGGTFVAVDEENISVAGDKLSRFGLYVEPTSAIVWNAFEQIADQFPDPVVMVLTGSGLKTL